MTQYRPRTSIYEAVRFDGVVHHGDGRYDVLFDFAEDRLPKWLRDALFDGDVQVVAAAPYLVLGIEDEEVHVHAGEYLMYEEGMGIFVVSGNELLEDFEEVPAVRQDATVQVTGVEATGSTLTFEGTPV
jgi:hypothetical protein